MSREGNEKTQRLQSITEEMQMLWAEPFKLWLKKQETLSKMHNRYLEPLSLNQIDNLRADLEGRSFMLVQDGKVSSISRNLSILLGISMLTDLKTFDADFFHYRSDIIDSLALRLKLGCKMDGTLFWFDERFCCSVMADTCLSLYSVIEMKGQYLHKATFSKSSSFAFSLDIEEQNEQENEQENGNLHESASWQCGIWSRFFGQEQKHLRLSLKSENPFILILKDGCVIWQSSGCDSLLLLGKCFLSMIDPKRTPFRHLILLKQILIEPSPIASMHLKDNTNLIIFCLKSDPKSVYLCKEDFLSNGLLILTLEVKDYNKEF